MNTTMPICDVVQQLVQTLGGPNVALIGNVKKTSIVSQWIKNESAPNLETEMRMRLALRITSILGQRWHYESIRAWFWGANSHVDDEAPIAVLSASSLESIQESLLRAANSFNYL